MRQYRQRRGHHGAPPSGPSSRAVRCGRAPLPLLLSRSDVVAEAVQASQRVAQALLASQIAPHLLLGVPQAEAEAVLRPFRAADARPIRSTRPRANMSLAAHIRGRQQRGSYGQTSRQRRRRCRGRDVRFEESRRRAMCNKRNASVGGHNGDKRERTDGRSRVRPGVTATRSSYAAQRPLGVWRAAWGVWRAAHLHAPYR